MRRITRTRKRTQAEADRDAAIIKAVDAELPEIIRRVVKQTNYWWTFTGNEHDHTATLSRHRTREIAKLAYDLCNRVTHACTVGQIRDSMTEAQAKGRLKDEGWTVTKVIIEDTPT